MKSTAFNNLSKSNERASTIYNNALSDQQIITSQSLTTKNTPTRDSSEKERIITVVHNSIIWFDWG
jgi:hypothetical protein